jgi:hypothetical protein
MKLSTLLVLFTISSVCFAQAPVKPPGGIYGTTPGSGPVTIPAQDWTAMQEMPKAEFQQKFQQLTDRINQAGCPVVLTSAEMTPYLMLLRASGGPATQGGLDLRFRNTSGKEIQSIELGAEFLAKKSIYDLRTDKLEVHLTAQGTRDINDAFDHLRHLPLPERSHPVMLNRIQLEHVTFTDGSIWTPVRDDACGFSPNRAQEIVSR